MNIKTATRSVKRLRLDQLLTADKRLKWSSLVTLTTCKHFVKHK